MPKTHRINFDFPYDEYRSLKLVCHMLNMTMKEFCTEKILKAIKENEDLLWPRERESSKEN